jgi:integrase
MRYPADPPTVDEIVAVMRRASDDLRGWRVRAMIVVLWRAGLRIQEALALAEHDLDHRRGSILVRSGKGGCRREVGMDEWGWEQPRPWLNARLELGGMAKRASARDGQDEWSSSNREARLPVMPSVSFRYMTQPARISRPALPASSLHAAQSWWACR